MKQIPLVIDFDGTMFDTAGFKEEIFRAFSVSGYDLEDIRSTFIAECMDYKYSPEQQFKRLLEIKHSNEKLVGARIANLYKSVRKFVYPDSESFLKMVDRTKYGVNLLTLGNVDFQMRKAKESGLLGYFDNIYICTEQKWDFIINLVEPRDYFIMIDDRADTLNNIKTKYPKSLCIQIARQDLGIEDAAKFYKDVYRGIKVHDLGQVLRYL